MKLYLYCSYTHSKRGFVLTQLKAEELIPISLLGAQGGGEKILEQFFSYDAFRIVFREFSDPNRMSLLPGTGGAVFGIRGLKGKISDRDAVINFAVLARKHEMEQLEKLAAGILSDPDGFGLSLSSCLSIGGICSYQADAKRIRDLLKAVSMQNTPEMLQRVQRAKDRIRTLRDQLRFAVYIGTWEQAGVYMHPQWLWKSCPKQAISQETFAKLLGRDIWQ